MEFIRYEYYIKLDNGSLITGSFTLKVNAKHPEIVQKLKAWEVERFSI